ncbi:MAG: cysteine-rich CWC family protein [Bacteroidota bacterium]
MPKHEEKFCPRCGTKFECKVGSILLCQCSTVVLNERERKFISERYDDCLCAKCMQELKIEFQNKKLKSRISSILGVHYKSSNQ